MRHVSKLSKNSQDIIIKRLKTKSISEIFIRKFGSSLSAKPEDRAKSTKYVNKIRGAVRLRNGLYYTSEEFAERKKNIETYTLP